MFEIQCCLLCIRNYVDNIWILQSLCQVHAQMLTQEQKKKKRSLDANLLGTNEI